MSLRQSRGRKMQNENCPRPFANRNARDFYRPPIRSLLLALAAAALCLIGSNSPAQTRRVVILKVDGLPNDMVDRFVHERDPLTGKSLLPWFDYIFYANGTR